jgi:ribosomal protein S18 acetylase RimI-like enzyme
MKGEEIRPATMADIEPVCSLLHEHMDARFSPDRWRRLMTYRWLDDKPDFGRVAIVDGRLVGFVGMVYSDRVLEGRRHRIVNICAWCLNKAHRKAGFGFELMRSAIADDAMSYTILTSSSRSVSLLEAIGYRILDDDRRIWIAKGDPTGLEIEVDPSRILRRVDSVARDMLRDHDELPVRPVLVADRTGSCLAVFSVAKKRDDVTYYDVLHLTNPLFLAARAQAIADGLLPRDRKAVLAVDTRLLQGHANDGTAERLLVPRYYKSSTLQPGQIDNMYSELQILDLKLD